MRKILIALSTFLTATSSWAGVSVLCPSYVPSVIERLDDSHAYRIVDPAASAYVALRFTTDLDYTCERARNGVTVTSSYQGKSYGIGLLLFQGSGRGHGRQVSYGIDSVTINEKTKVVRFNFSYPYPNDSLPYLGVDTNAQDALILKDGRRIPQN